MDRMVASGQSERFTPTFGASNVVCHDDGFTISEEGKGQGETRLQHDRMHAGPGCPVSIVGHGILPIAKSRFLKTALSSLRVEFFGRLF